MNAFLWNILLALAWAALTGRFTLATLGIGFGLGALIMGFSQRAMGASGYLAKLWQILGLALFFLWELLLANLRVAYDIVTPHHYMRPGVIAVPLDAQTDLEVTFLAMLVTLTPGTISIDVSADRRILYVHAMYIHDAEALRREIKHGYERRVLELLR